MSCVAAIELHLFDWRNSLKFNYLYLNLMTFP